MLRKISRKMSVVNLKSFALEPEDLTNTLNRKDELKSYYVIENTRSVGGKATEEGFKFFQSRNLEGGLKSARRKFQQAESIQRQPEGFKLRHRHAKRITYPRE